MRQSTWAETRRVSVTKIWEWKCSVSGHLPLITLPFYKKTETRPLFAHLQKQIHQNTESSKKMDGVWNRYNLKSTGRIYTFGVLKFSEKFKVLDLP